MSKRHRWEKPNSRYRYCHLTEEDQREFTAILKENFPGLIVCYVDSSAGEFLTYDSLADAPDFASLDLPEPGWKPRLAQDPDFDFDHFRLCNEPERSILVYRAPIIPLNLKISLPHRSEPLRVVGHRFIGDGLIQGHYYPDQPEVKRFVSRVFRLIGKFMSNSCELIDLETREVVETRHGTIIWAGPDTIRRCREEENFFLYIDFTSDDCDHNVGAKAIPKPVKRKHRPRA